MKLPSQRLCLVVASAALVLAGCTKKPTRPDPSATMLGPQGGPGSGAGSLNPLDVATTNPTGDLQARSDFDQSGQNRTALAKDAVYFDFDKSFVKTGERAKLQDAKTYLDSNAGMRLLLEGHCDWRGTAEYNLALGDRRAQAVKQYLQSIGVAPDRLDTVSKGSLEATKNADQAAAAKDRRVDIIVVQPSAGGALPTGTGAVSAPGAAPAGGPATPPPSGAL